MTGWTANDLEPPIAGTVLNGSVGVDLTSATTVVAHIKRSDDTTISRAVTPGDQTTAPGSWTLPLVTGDLPSSGAYAIEVQVTWPGTRPQTFGPTSFPVGREIA
jgi:hypothetical protein